MKNKQVLGDNVSSDYMRNNYGELVIYFGSLTVEQTDVYAKYESFSASSGMGGLLVLFLVGSKLTIWTGLKVICECNETTAVTFSEKAYDENQFTRMTHNFREAQKTKPPIGQSKQFFTPAKMTTKHC